jgi:hypothetical protein
MEQATGKKASLRHRLDQGAVICKRIADAGADVVGLNCIRGPATMMPLLRQVREAVKIHVAALPVPYRTSENEPSFQSLRDTHWHFAEGTRPFAVALDPFTCNRYEIAEFGKQAFDMGIRYPGSALRGRPASHPRTGGSRKTPAGEQVLRGHVEARLPRLRPTHQASAEGLRRQAVSWGDFAWIRNCRPSDNLSQCRVF